MKFVYFKMFSGVLRNRRLVKYVWEPAWNDSVFNCPPLTTWLLYVVKSLTLFKLLHNIFMVTIFSFQWWKCWRCSTKKISTQVLCCAYLITRFRFLEGWTSLTQDYTKSDTMFSYLRACNWSLQHTDEPFLRVRYSNTLEGKIQKRATENFNPGLTLIGLSGADPGRQV